jgi:hypothetical protein
VGGNDAPGALLDVKDVKKEGLGGSRVLGGLKLKAAVTANGHHIPSCPLTGPGCLHGELGKKNSAGKVSAAAAAACPQV